MPSASRSGADIAQRYPKMRPDEQQRVRQQMATWAQLSPEQRQAARERYKTMKTLPPEKKQEVRQKWEQYQTLPPETKRELAAKPPPQWRKPAAARGAQPAPGTAPPSRDRSGGHAAADRPGRPAATRRTVQRSEPRLTAGAPPAAPAAAHARPQMAPLVRRYASLGYEGLLLAAIILVIGFILTLRWSRRLPSPAFAVRVPQAGARCCRPVASLSPRASISSGRGPGEGERCR